MPGDGLAGQGWQTDPSGRHQWRYFSAGQATRLFRDDGTEGYDDPSAPEPEERRVWGPPPAKAEPVPVGEPVAAWGAPSAVVEPAVVVGEPVAVGATVGEPVVAVGERAAGGGADPRAVPMPVAPQPRFVTPGIAHALVAPLETTGQRPSGRRQRALFIALVLVVVVGGGIGVLARQGGRAGSVDAVGLIGGAPAATQRPGTAHFTVAINIAGQSIPSVMLMGSEDFATKSSQVTFGTGDKGATIRVVAGVEYLQSPVIRLPHGTHWVRIIPQDLRVSTQTGLIGSGNPIDGLAFLGTR